MRTFNVALRALPVIASVACVAYDTAGPPVPNINGTYTTKIAVRLANDLELRSDTLLAWITVQDLHYRGHFAGTYRTALGDSGLIAGVERPESTVVVDVFGAPPKPIAQVIALRVLYSWCDFPRLGTGALSGQLSGDSLILDGQGSLPCRYDLSGPAFELRTELQLRIVGIR